MDDNPIPIKRVTSQEMCKIFNEAGYWEKAKKGEFTTHLLESNVSKTLSQETVEIVSQMVSYRDSTGREMARVHQFLRPNGTLAASGMPDPKRLYKDGVLYRLQKKSKT